MLPGVLRNCMLQVEMINSRLNNNKMSKIIMNNGIKRNFYFPVVLGIFMLSFGLRLFILLICLLRNFMLHNGMLRNGMLLPGCTKCGE
mgnify:CR=1 FL=1